MTTLRTSIQLLILFALAAAVFAAQCGQPCPYGNNDCDDPACSWCNSTTGFGGTCAPGFPCNAICKANTDCDQTTDCKQCWGGRCTGGCWMPCVNDSFCGSPGCNKCLNGVCQLSSCATSCSADTDCKFGSCILCVGGRCRAKCAGTCTQNADCGADAKCPTCVAGKCAPNTTKLH